MTAKRGALLQLIKCRALKIRRMAHTQTSHLWLARFSARLMRLRPGMSFPSAVHRAVAVYGYADDWDPEDAALFFVETHRPSRRY